MASAKVNILSRLKKSKFNKSILMDNDYNTLYCNALYNSNRFFTTNKIDRMKDLLTNVHHAEVYDTNNKDIAKDVLGILHKKEVKTLLYSLETNIGKILSDSMGESNIELVPYPDSIDSFKKRLFSLDASITTTKGGIADTGSIIIWPTKEEPRLMSLVPPIHIAILDTAKLYNTFLEVIEKESWTNNMPTNIVLVSGPSKTADIEFELTHGVHGPKELIVLFLHS